MISLIKQHLRKKISLLVFKRIISNAINNILWSIGWIKSDSGMTHNKLTVTQSLAYINDVFSDYKTHAHIPNFYGHVCELGPGDNAGVALKILRDGATQVDLADRFYSHRDTIYQAQIYQAMASNDPNIAQILKGSNLFNERTFKGITRYYGKEAAGEVFFKSRPSTYDFIISRSVLEHTTDPLLTLESMYHALKPGGTLIHKVDLRDHGMFSPTFHDLKFLEIPRPIYWAMTYNSGLPNRVMIHEYQNCTSKLNGKCQYFITQLAYAGPIEPHVPFDQISKDILEKAYSGLYQHHRNFTKEFKKLPKEDTIVAGFFLILTKPKV